MRYLLLIYTNEIDDASASPAQQEAIMADYTAFGEFAKDQIVDGEALLPTTSATTVRMREGERLIADGPFAETKEQLGGYYLVNAANLDDAIALAARIPGAKWGSIEVRPIMEWN
ncbi:MAG: YciI family protein [Ktedonobacterales bacterium]|nr:YciI family protein [Ktedonobacterales bacterium]